MVDIISIRKCEIPEYLKQGELYRILMENNDDPNEEVTFPADVLKLDTTVYYLIDCDHLLNTVRFWVVKVSVFKELIEYVLSHRENGLNIVDVLQNYETEYMSMYWLRKIVVADPLEAGKVAIQSGSVDLVQPLTKLGYLLPSNGCDLAAEVGNLAVFACVCKYRCYWSMITCEIAAWRGYASIVQYMLHHGYKARLGDFQAAVRGGSLPCVQLLHDQFMRHPHCSELCHEAAQYGRLSVLKHLHEAGCPWDVRSTKVAARNGHLHCLKYLHENGCPWDTNVTTAAAETGHLHCLQYMYEHGCPWDTDVTTAAAEKGHLHCLEYLHEHGCPWDVDSICQVAARKGHLDCLQHAHEHGCILNNYTACVAVEGGHLACLQYAHRHGCTWSCNIAAWTRNGCCVYFQQGLLTSLYVSRSNPCYEYLCNHAFKPTHY